MNEIVLNPKTTLGLILKTLVWSFLLFSASFAFTQNTSSVENNIAICLDQDSEISCLDSLLAIQVDTAYYSKGEILFHKAKQLVNIDLQKTSEAYKSAAEYYILSPSTISQFKYVDSKCQQALYLSDVGNFQSAEKILLDVEHYTYEKIPKNIRAKIALSNSMGLFYSYAGRYGKSKDWSIKAIDYLLQIDTSQSADLAMKYTNLGLVYQNLNDHANAEIYLLKGYHMLRKFKAHDHPSCLLDTYNLGVHYLKIKEPTKALSYFDEAVTLLEAREKIDYIELNYFLNGRGATYSFLGETQKAFKDVARSVEINRKLYKAPNVYGIQLKSNLADISLKLDNEADFERYAMEAIEDFIYILKKNISILSTDDLLDFIARNKTPLHPIVNRLFAFPNKFGKLKTGLFEIQLLLKGLGLEREIAIHKYLDGNDSNDLYFEQWKSQKRNLENLYLNANNQEEVKEAEEKLSMLRKQLLIDQLDQNLFDLNFSSEQIKAALPNNCVAIEFDRFMGYYDMDLSKEKTLDAKKEGIYYALLMKKDSKHAQLIRLCREKDLIKILDDKVEKREAYVNSLYQSSTRGVSIETEIKGLHDLFYAPLLPYIKDIEGLYISPIGLMNRINFGAIPIDEFEVLNDNWKIFQLGSTRNILPSNRNTSYAEDALLIGGLDYNLGFDRSPKSKGSTEQNLWSQLTFTSQEVQRIGKLLKEKNAKLDLTLIDGEHGTEQNLRRLAYSFKSPRVIHIATHGFFLSLELDSKNKFQTIKNPMMRSGLILSGGNKGWAGQALDNKEDNVLTALEIAQMDLSHSELIVLSACETGLGDIENSEGVFGLQRAFKIAGAKYIIMSLWQVPDRETSVFMENFYENWLLKEMSIPDAFNQTQLEMRDRFFNPYQWAGFVLIE